ncbi:MAG: hypothetical protein LUC88_02215 [Prevotella sp.]|nr:hypothetical protein [Prevotella sp.]
MQTEQDNDFQYQRPSRRHRGEEDKPDRFFMLRNILNVIFIIGAVVGVLMYFYKDEQAGTIVILVSMMFKIVECVFRFMK